MFCLHVKPCSQQTNWTKLNCSQLNNFVTLTRVTNYASCNWVNLVQVSSVQLGRREHSHWNTWVQNSSGTWVHFSSIRRLSMWTLPLQYMCSELEFSSVQFFCCKHGLIIAWRADYSEKLGFGHWTHGSLVPPKSTSRSIDSAVFVGLVVTNRQTDKHNATDNGVTQGRVFSFAQRCDLIIT